MHTHSRLDEYATPEGLAEKHPNLFTLPQLRWALRFRDDNGLAEHVTKFGRRLYIHEPGFVAWFHRQGQEGRLVCAVKPSDFQRADASG